MSDSLNSMLEEGQLSLPLYQGVIRLLPKFKGAPLASQMRPITLLNTDYKLLTKVFWPGWWECFFLCFKNCSIIWSEAGISCREPSLVHSGVHQAEKEKRLF